jgi:histone deacetylase 1/2
MHNEIQSLDEHHTWDLVPLPPGRQAIATKWVFKLKTENPQHPRYKARLVAKGFTQIFGLDYNETFAPVVRPSSVRLLFALAALHGLQIIQFDVETAFLNSALNEIIYVQQPQGFISSDKPNYVCKLNKSLYGLKQSSHEWSNEFKCQIINLSFTQSHADESIFISTTLKIIIAIYVDDILVLAEDPQVINQLAASLGKIFKLRNLGPVKRFLGIEVHRPTLHTITINQSQYIDRLLIKFNMSSCNPAKTPLDPSIELRKASPDEEVVDGELYRSIVGSIMHLAVFSRPDIMYAVSKLSQYNDNPSVLHFRAAKHLLRYIKGTKHFSLEFGTGKSPTNPHLHGYSDASYANDLDDRKSTTGYVFFFGNGPISWQSRKQPTVAQSTMEAEYIALSEASKEAMFLRQLLLDINIPQNEPTIISTDSQDALSHVKNNINHQPTKHIDVKHHYIREIYTAHQVNFQFVPAEIQIADILTKPLKAHKHQANLELLQIN